MAAFARLGTVCWVLAFSVLAVKGLVFPGEFGFNQGHTAFPQLFFTTFAFLLVLPFVFGSGGTSLVHWLAETRVMIFLGTISYGIFLWHQPVIHWIKFNWVTSNGWVAQHPLTTWLFAIAVTVPIATVSWYVVERPAMRLKERLVSVPGPAERSGAHAQDLPGPGAETFRGRLAVGADRDSVHQRVGHARLGASAVRRSPSAGKSWMRRRGPGAMVSASNTVMSAAIPSRNNAAAVGAVEPEHAGGLTVSLFTARSSEITWRSRTQLPSRSVGRRVAELADVRRSRRGR